MRIFPDNHENSQGRPRPRFFLSALVMTIMLAAGCAGKETPEPPGRPTPPARHGTVEPTARPHVEPTARPYTVLGQTYHPIASADGFAEQGVASWYGPQFHTKRTASGEVYNMYDLTAAHRVLPMQTKIKVTNLENGKSVVLRVNDRGPFVNDRVVDLSYAAAQELDVVRPGTAKVHVEALGRWPGGIPGRFFVQVGAFSLRENADKLMREMQNGGYSGARVVFADVKGQGFWRVQAGEFQDLDQARSALNTLASRNPSAFVIAD